MVAALVIFSTSNRLKGSITSQLVFGRDMILLIKHTVDWELIHQLKPAQINKDNICKNSKRVDYYYKVRYKVMLNNNSTLKYESPYNGKF